MSYDRFTNKIIFQGHPKENLRISRNVRESLNLLIINSFFELFSIWELINHQKTENNLILLCELTEFASIVRVILVTLQNRLI